jgi:hypothetical protein
MRIDAGMDTGEMLLQRETPIGPSETAPELAKRLAEISAPLMVETLRALRDGIIQPRKQNQDEASAAPLLKKDDGRIDWLQPAQVIYNRVRGFSPWPGAFTTFRNTPCQLSGQPASNLGVQHAAPLTPGTIHMQAGRLFVACGEKTLLQVSRVKPEGRKEVSALEFASGAHVQPELAGIHLIGEQLVANDVAAEGTAWAQLRGDRSGGALPRHRAARACPRLADRIAAMAEEAHTRQSGLRNPVASLPAAGTDCG